jgi:hypothetical protein
MLTQGVGQVKEVGIGLGMAAAVGDQEQGRVHGWLLEECNWLLCLILGRKRRVRTVW